MTYLLDTHVLLWMLCEPDRIAPTRRTELASPQLRLMVSAASAMEIATKTRLGKLKVGSSILAAWSERLREIAVDELPVRHNHALLAGAMTWEHRDPFDRLLVAQAITEGLCLVSADRVMSEVVGLQLLDPRH